ncbi:hypothetical protein ABTP77_21475, partial [Acinetobacter baumannii]
LGVEFGLDLGQLDLGLGLEFLVDRIGLGLLLLDLSTMRDGKLIRLRLGLQRKDPRIWRRRWRRRRRLQQLAGLRLDGGRIVEEPARVLVPH